MTLLSVPWKKKISAPAAFVRRKDHHGNLFTSSIAFYGLIPSSTICAWYLNAKMVPIFPKKWVMGLLSTLGVREYEPKCADPVSDEMFSIIVL